LVYEDRLDGRSLFFTLGLPYVYFYDFDEGGMFFVSPNQIPWTHDQRGDQSGYTFLFHHDFLIGQPLKKNQAIWNLFLRCARGVAPVRMIIFIFKIIEDELKDRTDDFSQDVLI